MNDQNELEWMTTAFGWVWMGYHEVTKKDFDALDAYLQTGGYSLKDVQCDQLSFVGRLHRDYTAEIWEQGTSTTRKLGGEGSHTYETQKVIGKNYGSGDVEFRPEVQSEIWHIGPEGRTHGIVDYPKTGRSYHVDEWGQTTAGPRPGSGAAEQLGDGEYKWNGQKAWWMIR